MAVPLLAPERLMDGGAQTEQLLAAAHKLLLGGRYILGDEVQALEREVAAWLDVPHALGVSSGTDALLLALMAVGIRPGDQVICPSYTFFATAGVIARLGAQPVFVDSCPMCMTLDVQSIPDVVTGLTRAVLPVHLFGHSINSTALMPIAQQHRLAVVEDVAQAMGTGLGSPAGAAGTVGDLGCLSFFPSKNLGGFGDGGMVVTHDADLYQHAQSLRVHGAGDPRYVHHHVGGNFRLDALQATLLRQRLPQVHAMLAARKSHAAHYHSQFMAAGIAWERLCGCAGGDPIATPRAGDTPPLGLPRFAAQDTVNQYVITLPCAAKRDALQRQLNAQGLANSIYYPLPLHLQPCFAHLGYSRGQLPVAERLSETSLALPIASELTADEIDAVAQAVIREIDS